MTCQFPLNESTSLWEVDSLNIVGTLPNFVILPPCHLLQPCSRPGTDVALGGGDGEANGLGNGLEVLGLKLIR